MPVFRIVVTESRNSTKSGKYLESIGSYDPVRKTKEVDAEKAKYWISKGAKPSDTLHNFFVDQKIVGGKKVNALPKRRPVKKGEVSEKPEAKAEAKAAAPEETKPPAAAGEKAAEPEHPPKEAVASAQGKETNKTA